jgi:hypothetical protein
MRAELGHDLVPHVGEEPPKIDAWRYARDTYLTDPDLLARLRGVFTESAVAQAREAGLLDPAGPGSLCHPDRSRTVYGDGTVVRPLYRPPTARREVDPVTGKQRTVYLDSAGQPTERPTRRFDPDAAEHHGHSGPVHGSNFVALSIRGDAPGSRVVLAVAAVPRPGQEAATAVETARSLWQVAGSGMQAFVYDGALRGVHIDELMTQCGLVVINKVHRITRRRGQDADGAPNDAHESRKTPGRWHTLGTWTHDTPDGDCHHQLAAVDGAVSEVGLDDAGAPAVLARLVRRQVKRPRRSTGRFHFNVAYAIPCRYGEVLAWITPHSTAAEAGHRQADAVRVIAQGEPDFDRLYPRRSDAEALNRAYKATLPIDRATSLGRNRQLLDVLCFALLHNARTAAASGVGERRHLRAA